MSGIRKYHPFFAAALLALYAFIAAPVQLWHQHEVKTISAISTLAKGNEADSTEFTGIVESTVDTNCKVCSHQYAVYHSPVMNDMPAPLLKYLTNTNHYTTAARVQLVYSSSNKGPPARS